MLKTLQKFSKKSKILENKVLQYYKFQLDHYISTIRNKTSRNQLTNNLQIREFATFNRLDKGPKNYNQKPSYRQNISRSLVQYSFRELEDLYINLGHNVTSNHIMEFLLVVLILFKFL